MATPFITLIRDNQVWEYLRNVIYVENISLYSAAKNSLDVKQFIDYFNNMNSPACYFTDWTRICYFYYVMITRRDQSLWRLCFSGICSALCCCLSQFTKFEIHRRTCLLGHGFVLLVERFPTFREHLTQLAWLWTAEPLTKTLLPFETSRSCLSTTPLRIPEDVNPQEDRYCAHRI